MELRTHAKGVTPDSGGRGRPCPRGRLRSNLSYPSALYYYYYYYYFVLFFNSQREKNLFFSPVNGRYLFLFILLILLFKQIYINLDEYNDADYVNFDMAEEAQ